MKKICLLAMLILAGAVIAAIGFHEPEPILSVPSEAMELPALSPERLKVEDQGREALRFYIMGRISAEKIACEEKVGPDIEPALLQETNKCWQETGKKAKVLKDMLTASESAAQLSTEKQVSLSFPFMGVASASMPVDRKKEVELTEERKRIIAFYADYPYADTMQILVGQIEHDTALARNLLAQAREGSISFQQAAAKLSEGCQIKLTEISLGGSLKFPRPESHEAFASFWGGTETFVRIAPEGTALLMGKLPDIVFLTGDTEIKMVEKPLSALDVDALAKKWHLGE